MTLTDTQKPHVPTLASAVIALLVIVVIYHLAFSKRR
jgi:hypothetical protein